MLKVMRVPAVLWNVTLVQQMLHPAHPCPLQALHSATALCSGEKNASGQKYWDYRAESKSFLVKMHDASTLSVADTVWMLLAISSGKINIRGRKKINIKMLRYQNWLHVAGCMYMWLHCCVQVFTELCSGSLKAPCLTCPSTVSVSESHTDQPSTCEAEHRQKALCDCKAATLLPLSTIFATPLIIFPTEYSPAKTSTQHQHQPQTCWGRGLCCQGIRHAVWPSTGNSISCSNSRRSSTCFRTSTGNLHILSRTQSIQGHASCSDQQILRCIHQQWTSEEAATHPGAVYSAEIRGGRCRTAQWVFLQDVEQAQRLERSEHPCSQGHAWGGERHVPQRVADVWRRRNRADTVQDWQQEDDSRRVLGELPFW